MEETNALESESVHWTWWWPLDRTGMSEPYVWTADLDGWNANGATDGVTVDIVAVGDGGDPYETVTVTATVSGGTLDVLFLRQELSFP